MGDHSRYDKYDVEGKLDSRPRTPGAVGRHRISYKPVEYGPQRPTGLLRPLPAMPGTFTDATVWDLPAIRRPGKVAAEIQRHSYCSHRSPYTSPWTGLSRRVTRWLAAISLALGLTLTGGLAVALGGSAPHVAKRRAVVAMGAALPVPSVAKAVHSEYGAAALNALQAAKVQAARARAAALKKVTTVRASAPPAVAPPPPAGTGPGSHSLYQTGQLEALWVAEGGSPAVAATAACIAEHESGDGSGNSRPWADNGVDLGLWQIDPGNYSGPRDDLFNPVTNAKVAVMLYGQSGWYPWTTRHMCGV